MRTPDDNDLDRLFKEGLNTPGRDDAFREEDWEAMESLLDDKPRKNRGIIWLYWLSGSVAAMLILFFGLELLKPAILIKNNTAKVSVRRKASAENGTNKAGSNEKSIKNSPGKTIGLTELASAQKKIYTDKNSIKESNRQAGRVKNTTDKMLLVSSKNNGKNNINHLPGRKQNNAGTNNLAVNKASSTQKQTTVLAAGQANTASQFYADKRSISINDTTLTAIEVKNIFTDNAARLAVIPVAQNLLANRKPITQIKTQVKANLKMPPRFTLAILTAPDVNGVSSFTGSKIGTNAGLQFSVKLTRKWSISTGAVYAAKPYEISVQQYQNAATFRGKDGEVVADCKVLDIPVDLNYQVYGRYKNTFSAGAGLSSYFILRENYNLNFIDNTSINFNIVNQNKHILSVLNLHATYQRQVNPSFNLIVQPYLKLPLTPIGFERINLQSAGIALGVGWNISPFKNR